MFHFNPTALIYSSHNRCELIHRWWIVERALKSIDNKSIFFLPMSMGRYDQQHYSWGTFEWYLNKFTKWGLEFENFYWHDPLEHKDVDHLFERLVSSEVVILGGGSSTLGMDRYRYLGEKFYNDRNLFARILHERQNSGKLTVGFSAGADQLCDFISSAFDFSHPDPHGFGLLRNTACTLHHEWGREGNLAHMASISPHIMVFGLPNDSGIGADQGYLASGNIWQVLEFIVDQTWDLPNDSWHIKSRSGMKIEHFYHDGRKFDLDTGDRIVRVMSPDNSFHDAWIVKHGGIYDYWTHQWSGYNSINEILASH